MELSTVEIPRVGARQKAADYRAAAKRSSDPRERREFEEIARAYRIAARDDVALIALTPTIAAGGTVTRTRVQRQWSPSKNENVEYRTNYLVTNLAVCRWDAAFCYTLGVQQDGSIEFIDSLGRRDGYRKGAVELETGFEPPDGFRAGVGRPWSGAWTAMVPIVPPEHRPARGLGDRLVLWEVDRWQWTTPPAPPGDPALVRHVGGDIYAVEAVWDLTELEKLVLSGRRP
jgi:hypothetical protein